MVPIDALIQAIAGARDTLIMKQVVPERGLLDQVVAICTVITTVALTVFSVFAVPAAYRFRGTYKKADKLLDKIQGDIEPITRHIHTISEDVAHVTRVIRADVDKVTKTINKANDRLQSTVNETEQRLNEFNALLAVVQDEAEQVFVSTASAVRGVRTGAAAFGRRSRTDLASEELDPADLAGAIERQLESEEVADGYDSNPESSAAALSAAPRVRPRARGRRG
jgi:uncharacterized protein YoxC